MPVCRVLSDASDLVPAVFLPLSPTPGTGLTYMFDSQLYSRLYLTFGIVFRQHVSASLRAPLYVFKEMQAKN